MEATTAIPQSVLSPLTRAALILVVTVDPGGEDRVRDLLPDLSGLQRAIGFRAPEGDLSCVTGIGADAWGRLFGSTPRPAGLHVFREVTGPVHHAPSTPGDLLFHIRAQQQDLCFALATEIMDRIRGAVTVCDEVHGFRYFDARDLLGFVDGTENPVGPGAADAVLIGAEDPAYAAGSYVIVQKYVHDLRAWNALSTEAQELVIGRRKLSDVELADSETPASAHTALTTIVDPDGTERQILRDNMPFGSVGQAEFGTYFIGYARTPSVTERMLDRMFLGDGTAAHDRILDFSTAVTGNLFFAPAETFLDDPPFDGTVLDDPPVDAGSEAAGGPETAAAGPAPAVTLTHTFAPTLGVGDLRGH